MKQTIKSLMRLVLSLGLMGLFLYLAFSGTPPEQLWQTLTRAAPLWVAAMVATTLATLVLRAWRWTVLLRPFAPQVRIVDAFLALAICYAANIAIPRSGEAARALSLRWSRQAPMGSSLATVVVERIIDMVVLVLFVGLSILLLHGRLEEAYPWMESAALVALVGCLGLLGFLFGVYRYRDAGLNLSHRLLEPLSARLAERVVELIDAFVSGLAALHDRSAYLKILVSSALLNGGYLLIIYEGFCAYGLQRMPGVGWTAALVVMAVSAIGMVVPTPGGTGSYHLFFKQSLMLFGVSAALSLACATFVHAMATATYLVIGGPAFLLQRARSAGTVQTDGEPS